MIIEGKNSVTEALNSDVTFNKLYINKNLQAPKVFELAKQRGIRVEFVDKALLDKMSATKNHQGIIAEVSDFKYSSIESILEKIKDKEGFLVLLDGIEDPHNLGSIVRVCEGAGVDGIVLEKQRACPVNETVVRVSAGAISHMDIARVTNLNSTIKQLKDNGFWIFGCELGGKELFKSNLKGKVALIIGSEGKGIGSLTKSLCDEIITLPMFGKVNSLNASTATSVFVYEVIRQRINNERR